MTCPLSLVTKRGSSFRFFRVVLYLGGELVQDFFFRGSVLVCSEDFMYFYFFLYLHKPLICQSYDHFIYIHCNLSFIYDDDVCFFSPISTCVISFLSLNTCFFMYIILIFVSHMMS